MTSDEPLPGEIEAYVSGQLDTSRKFIVETHLSRHPDQAAKVMAELGTTSALKLILGTTEPGDEMPAHGFDKPRKLATKPLWCRPGPLTGLAATIIAGLMLIGLLPQMRAPEYVGYAVNSHRIAALRANMHSQIETPDFDANEIISSTQIAMPKLPADWNITDVQLFPTPKGPALLVALKTSTGQPLSLFAIRERTGAPNRPDAVREGAQSVAYWQHGDMSYALTGETEPVAIDATAEALSRSWL